MSKYTFGALKKLSKRLTKESARCSERQVEDDRGKTHNSEEINRTISDHVEQAVPQS